MGASVGMVLAGVAFAAVGIDLAVAILCFGWPRGELWPLDERWAGATLLGAAASATGAGLLTLHAGGHGALRLYLAGGLLAAVNGLCGAIPSSRKRSRALQAAAFFTATAVGALGLWLVRPIDAGATAGYLPALRVAPRSFVTFVAVCAICEAAEALTIARTWPRTEARAALVAGPAVFALGIVDLAALTVGHVPLLGAVTASALVAVFIVWRVLSQIRVALRGIEGRVPGYALRRFLGAGGMAEVFLAEGVGLVGGRRLAAVKRVRRDLAGDAELCAMFLDEARLAATLRHPNVVRVHAVGLDAGRPFIAMELVDGPSLAALIARRTALDLPIPLAAVAEIGARLCDALAYAHALAGDDGRPLGLVHRDVSPQNVLLSRDGAVKLIDFGIARARTRAARTEAGRVRGKIAYAAPEQLRGEAMDARTDLFALGAVLYELTTLEPPFGGGSENVVVAAILEGRRAPISQRRPDAGALGEAIERALAAEPEKRFPDAAAFRAALDAARGGALEGPSALRDLVESVTGAEGSPVASSTHRRTAAEPRTVVGRRAASRGGPRRE